MSYIVNLAKKLTDLDFNVASNMCDSENITEFSRLVTFYKQEGHLFYGVCIINCDNGSDYKNIANVALKGFERIDINKVIINIFLSSKSDDELLKYTHNDVEDYNGKTVNIKWLIDTTSESIIVKGSQPDDILGIRQALIESFENDTGHSVDTRSLLKQKEIANEILIKSHIPIVTYILMMLNLVFLIIMYTDFGSSIIEKMWLDKNLVSKGEYYRLFTYMFTHGGIEHFVCNTFTLFIIGTRLEKYSGSIKFLVLYILSGIGAGLVSFLVAPYGVAVGASGAIFGIIGGLIYMIKKIKKNIGGFDYSVAVLYAIIGIFSGFFMTNIDNFAHIGGLIFGLILAVILRLEK